LRVPGEGEKLTQLHPAAQEKDPADHRELFRVRGEGQNSDTSRKGTELVGEGMSTGEDRAVAARAVSSSPGGVGFQSRLEEEKKTHLKGQGMGEPGSAEGPRKGRIAGWTIFKRGEKLIYRISTRKEIISRKDCGKNYEGK